MIRTLHRWILADRSLAYKVVFASVATTLALVVRLFVDHALPPGFPYLTFFPAIILTTFFAGVRAGVATAAVSGVLSWYFFITPQDSFALTGTSAVALAFYVVIVATDIVLIYVMAQALLRLARERARADRLATSRDLMFRELQHRVSNNLAVVASLIKMQRRTVQDEAARQVLDTASGRLNLIARIQRELHDPTAQTVDVSRFLGELIQDIVVAAAARDRVATTVDADPVVVDAERAIPIALIVTELLSNAVEHAFGDGANGVIRVELSQNHAGEARLSISDDGQGLPEDFSLETTHSLGLTIARELAAQIEATLTMERTDEGSRSLLVFPAGDGRDRHGEAVPATQPPLLQPA